MDYPTASVELTCLDMLNIRTMLENRIEELLNVKREHPDMAYVCDEQIAVHGATKHRIDAALTSMYPSVAR